MKQASLPDQSQKCEWALLISEQRRLAERDDQDKRQTYRAEAK